MSDEPCGKWCPFLGCKTCAYQGGTVAAQADSASVRYDMRTAKTPATASTVRGRGPTEITGRTPPMVAMPTPPCQTNRENGLVR